MTNCITKSFHSLVKEAKELRSSKPNRLRGGLWMLASAVALVAGLLLTSAGGACLFGAGVLAFSGAGWIGAIVLGGLGVSLILSGVPAGIFVAIKFAANGWADLTARKKIVLSSSTNSGNSY